MIELAFYCFAITWAFWCAVNAALLVLGLTLEQDYPHFDGFRVHVPDSWRTVLTGEELRAVVEHEEGHRANLHVWKNFARRCCFLVYTDEVRAQQELEADDHCTNPRALASALRKMSLHPFDLARAARLEKKYLAGGMPA